MLTFDNDAQKPFRQFHTWNTISYAHALSSCVFEIVNGVIADGTGRKSRINHGISIIGDRLRFSRSPNSRGKPVVIDAENLVIAPGFIDAHSHSDIAVLRNPKAENRLLQGITTEVTGNCGFSPFPVTSLNRDNMKRDYLGAGVRLRWQSLGEYAAMVDSVRPAVNIAPLQGHGNLRSAAMGYAGRPPTAKELGAMKRLLSESMRAGAFGFSSGLEYTPSSFADWMELAELCSVVARYGGVYSTHMRNEDDMLRESVDESLKISSKSGARLEISHLKSTRSRNWGTVVSVLSELERKSRRNSAIGWDAYPYDASHTDLTITLPKHVMDGGFGVMLQAVSSVEVRSKVKAEMMTGRNEEDWKAIVVEDIAARDARRFNNMNLDDISKLMGVSPAEAVFRLLEANGRDIPIIVHNMSEQDVDRVFSHPKTGIGSDSSIYTGGHPHPRAFGTFPRSFRKYVRELGTASLERMVRKASALTAERFSLGERGFIRDGYFADVVIFDPEKIQDHSTYENPTAEPSGVKYVLVNGILEVENGRITGRRGGRVLRRGTAP